MTTTTTTTPTTTTTAGTSTTAAAATSTTTIATSTTTTAATSTTTTATTTTAATSTTTTATTITTTDATSTTTTATTSKDLQRKTGHSRDFSVTLCNDSAPSDLRVNQFWSPWAKGSFAWLETAEIQEGKRQEYLFFNSPKHKIGKDSYKDQHVYSYY